MQILSKDSICLLTVDTLCCANLRDANLRDANLRDADLRCADLSCADLRCANLRGADLRYANLRGATLRDADLCDADLRDADLRYADLRCADLRDANLRDAKINWGSHDLIAEILRQDAKEDIEKLQIPGLIILLKDRCWDYFLKLDHPQKSWAIQVLKDYGCKKITN